MKFHFTIRSFSREETTFLKGIAILLIVLHNYYRWVVPVTGENEFWFNALSVSRSWVFLRSNPLEFFHVFFNFLGHYGVQAFIVISAYGLTISYRKSRPPYGKFVLHRFDKLYPSLILAGMAFIIVTLFTSGKLIGMGDLTNLGIQFTLFANLVPGKAMVITGPWWFYSFIFQFYLVFPLLMWIHRRSGWKGLAGLVILGYLFSILLYKPMTDAHLNPYMTFMGHLPELCLGIFLATREHVKLPWWGFLIAVSILVGGNIYGWLWPFANLGAAVILLISVQGLISLKARIQGMYSLVTSIGVVSMYLFAVHGFLRSPFIGLANLLESPVASLLIGVLFVGVACGIAVLLQNTESAARKWIAAPGTRLRSLARFGFLALLVTGGFALLLSWNYAKEDADKAVKEVTLVESVHTFEEPIAGRWDLLTDSLAHDGIRSVVMDNNNEFSAGFAVGFDSLDVQGIESVEISAWLNTPDSSASLHLVLEIWDKPGGIRVEWESEFIQAGTHPINNWFRKTFRYQIPKAYLASNYYIKTFAWKPSEGIWYMDDFSLKIKASRSNP